MMGNRRDFLRAGAAMFLAGLSARALGESTGEIMQEALKRTALKPGQAAAKLAAITPRHALKPFSFALETIPGISRDTNFIHYEHHFLEYFWRWENGERRLLANALKLGSLADCGCMTGDFDEQRQLLLDHYEELRQSANMVILHRLYWEGFSTARDAGRAMEAAALVDSWKLETCDRPEASDWIFLTRENEKATVKFVSMDNLEFPPGMKIIGAIDAVSHAWVLDFPKDLCGYLQNVLCNMPAEQWERWRKSSLKADEKKSEQPALNIPGADTKICAEAIIEISALHKTPLVGDDAELAAEGLALAAGRKGAVLIGATELYGGTKEIILQAAGRPFGLANTHYKSKIEGYVYRNG